MLSALAARTERATLATGVLLGALRPALLLAQAAATLDQISAGRFVLGLGAGFPFPETERQFEAVGVPYEGRVRRLSETIAAMRLLWAGAGEPVDFEGSHIALEQAELEPAPHTPGGPQVWMAGAGVQAGTSYGETDDFSYNIVKDPVHVHDFQATLKHLMGIDHERLTYKFQGRRFRLTDVHGKLVKGLLS